MLCSALVPELTLSLLSSRHSCVSRDVVLLVVLVLVLVRVGRCWREQGNIDLGTDRTAIEIAAGGNHTCARLDTNEIKVSA